MEIPAYQPFYLHSPEDLRAEIARLGLDIPVGENLTPLGEPLAIGGRHVPNRFCAQPITGFDALANGAPGELTTRRYRALASSGYGLIWMEATIAGAAGPARRLRLHPGSAPGFGKLLVEMRRHAVSWTPDPAQSDPAQHRADSHRPLIILQLTTPPLPELPEDAVLQGWQVALSDAAVLAWEAGFDGIDLQCSHGSLPARLLSARDRPGSYGGSLSNRARFLLETLGAIRARAPQLVLAIRLGAFDAVRGGFGVAENDFRQMDWQEPRELARRLGEAGVTLLNVTASSPVLRAPGPTRGTIARSDFDAPEEHPLATLQRQLQLAAAFRQSTPGLAVVASGWSWLRQFAPSVAAAGIEAGLFDFVGIGRGALAAIDIPNLAQHGETISPEHACIVCHACTGLYAEGEPVGCVIRDEPTYGPIYRAMRRFDSDRLLAGAKRCHFCEAAPCVTASPTRTDIPTFIRAYLAGDEAAAYEIIRASDPLPELTARYSPAWLESEGACIEKNLTGTPVPILDLQYTIAWRARQRGATAVRLPALGTGGRVAIIGGGPAGLAAAVSLLEHGHSLEIFERSDRLGGVAARLLPGERSGDFAGEIAALFNPAIAAGRLQLHFQSTLGEQFTLEELRAQFSAVLMATGRWSEVLPDHLWHELTPGVLTALTFLEGVQRGEITSVPARVALLAGEDAAMDAARALRALGAHHLSVIASSSRADLHWHMPESWFAEKGVQALMEWTPSGYVLDERCAVSGLRLFNRATSTEMLLPVEYVVDARVLSVESHVRTELEKRFPRRNEYQAGVDGVYAAGSLVNGGASASWAIREGLAAARAIHAQLSSPL